MPIYTGGSDFEEESVTFVLRGVTNETYEVDVSIIDDSVVERPESEEFGVGISSSSPLVNELRVILNPNQAVIVIIDNDGKLSCATQIIC